MGKIDEVRSAMMAAMKAKDKETKESLSMLLGALKNRAIDKRADLTEEEEILSLIFPRSSSTLRRLYRSRIWYLDILFSNDPINVN